MTPDKELDLSEGVFKAMNLPKTMPIPKIQTDEKVAKRIIELINLGEKREYPPIAWSEQVAQAYLDLKQKLREPTEEMIEAGTESYYIQYDLGMPPHIFAERIFKAMIEVMEKKD